MCDCLCSTKSYKDFPQYLFSIFPFLNFLLSAFRHFEFAYTYELWSCSFTLQTIIINAIIETWENSDNQTENFKPKSSLNLRFPKSYLIFLFLNLLISAPGQIVKSCMLTLRKTFTHLTLTILRPWLNKLVQFSFYWIT